MKIAHAASAVITKLLPLLIASGLITGTLYASAPQNNPQSAVSSDSFVVIAVGDIACSPKDKYYNKGLGQGEHCQHTAVVNAINREPQIDAAILLGDIQYQNGEYDNFTKSFQPVWSKVRADHFLAVPGNHDYGIGYAGDIDSYKHALPETFGLRFINFGTKTYGSWEYKNWLIMGMDSDCELLGGCDVADPQVSWLKSTLAEHPTECSLAFWHYPIFSSGRYGRNEMVAAWNALEKSGADIVLNGHDHIYERFAVQALDPNSPTGMREFIVGTGGYNLHNFRIPYQAGHAASAREFGYLKLTLHQGSYDWEFINIRGQSLDSGSSSCNQRPSLIGKPTGVLGNNSSRGTVNSAYPDSEPDEE